MDGNFPSNSGIPGPSGSVQGLLSVSLQIGTSFVCRIVLAQIGHRASRVSGVGEIDFLGGGAAKTCCKRCGLRERKTWCHIYNELPCAFFFLHCNISEIGLIIIAGFSLGFHQILADTICVCFCPSPGS